MPRTPAILVLDIETTGLDPTIDKVVEFATCLVTRDSGVLAPTEVFSRLVNPGQPIPPEASAAHQVVDADVAQAPPLADVLEAFAIWLADLNIAPGVFCTHNATFDRGFLTSLAQRWPAAPWLCTFRLARLLWPDIPSHSHQALRYRLRLNPPFALAQGSAGRADPHSAAGDAIVTASLLCQELEAVRASFPDIVGLRQLAEFAQKPYRFQRIMFGKHKGQLFSDAPDDYLAWLSRDSTDPDILYTVQQERAERRGLIPSARSLGRTAKSQEASHVSF